MERTASGHSIRAEPTPAGPGGGTELLEDDIAAERVRAHMANFRRKFPDSKHERILRSIINPRINAEDELDNDSLESIFSAANEIFFNGRLSQRQGHRNDCFAKGTSDYQGIRNAHSAVGAHTQALEVQSTTAHFDIPPRVDSQLPVHLSRVQG
ncbi:hypothetical protein N0V85_002625 [Neurospora sp. IMI 360204]|nr:hypothetical protein N0V85_002625 [Neurospora sp. IMI 360204]